MSFEWALRNTKTGEITRGISEKEVRVLLKIRDSSVIEIYKSGWPEWKNAADVTFEEDELFDPTVCPQLPPNYKNK